MRVALLKQPYSPTGTSVGPTTMANGGIQKMLTDMGAVLKIEEAALTTDEAIEYGGWKKLSMALGHFADLVEKNERAGYFTVSLLATCPSMRGWSAVCTLRPNSQADQNRIAVAGRASRLQHARNHAQWFAWRHARRGGNRPSVAKNAYRGASRSTFVR